MATEAPEWQPIATATPVPAQQPVIDQQAQYRCTNHMPFRLMAEPTYQSDQVAMVEKTGVSMVVYEWGETWCLVSCEGLAGYASTNALYAFSRMSDLPLPGYHTCTGIAVLAGKVTLANSSFESNVLPVGTILAVENAEGTVPVYRETGVLPEGVYSYVPFVAAEDAQPGDLLYAFTTFYNYESGGRYAEERRFNIELACQRMHVVLQSGETFSFNDRSGVYADRSGYVNAPNLSLSDVEIGGGVGQVVATIYNAVLGLPLRIDETHVNRASGVAYVPVNLDACVTETRDFRFTNTLPYTIELQVLPQNGALTAFVYCSAMDQ